MPMNTEFSQFFLRKCAENVRISILIEAFMAIVVRKRKNGQNSYMVRYEPAGQQAVTRTFHLRSQAEAFEREIKRAKGLDTLEQLTGSAQKVTVSEAIKVYRADALPHLANGGQARHAQLVRIEEEFGRKYVTALKVSELTEWCGKLSRLDLSVQTIHHHLNAFSALVEFSRRSLGVHLPENPLRLVTRPKLAKPRDRRLRGSELEWLMKAAKLSPHRDLACIITVAIETSMRLGELLAMRWPLVDLQRRIVHLPTSKNGESRTVALSSVAVAALNGLPRRIDGRVWGWVADDSFENAWRRCKARAVRIYEEAVPEERREPDFLSDLRFHDLRREATSRLFEKGLGIMEVASMTGHKTLSMLRVYTKMDAERLAAKLG